MSLFGKSAPSAVVGLDIGGDTIKVAEAKLAGGEITITGLGVARTPEGAVENEVIVDPQALGQAIKSLLASSGIKTKKCVSSVAGQSQVVARVIEVPKMERDELAETMKWEVERHVPFSPDDVVMDFHPVDELDKDPDSQNMHVLLAVAQQDLIESHVAALFAAGLQPLAIDIEPLANSRALIETARNGTREEIVAIVDIGANGTEVGVFERGALTFPSPPLAIGGMSFTREISEALGQTLEEAEVRKKEYAAVDLAAMEAGAAPAEAGGAEPTQFDTAFAPDQGLATAFDAGEEASEEPPAGGEPPDAASFTETFDGPVFDVPEDQQGGYSFDIGDEEPESPSRPSFDLGEQEPAGEPVEEPIEQPVVEPGPTSFDLGETGAEDVEQTEGQVAPDFDLEEPESEEEEPQQAPAFDLSDTDEQADLGQPAEEVPAKPVPQAAESMAELVFKAISGVFVDLATEIRRSLEYYNTTYSKMPNRMILCGGTAKIPHLDEFLSRELGIPVQVGDPLANVKVNVPGASEQYLKEMSPLLSVSIGLAIRDMIG